MTPRHFVKIAWRVVFPALVGVVIVAAVPSSAFSQEIQKVSLSLPPDMIRADLYALRSSATPVAVLVLCPGANGNGEGFLRQTAWRDFARTHRLGLVGLSFASNMGLLNNKSQRGYYYAPQGSGQALLDGVRAI